MTGTALVRRPGVRENLQAPACIPIPTNVEYGALRKDAWLVERHGRAPEWAAFSYFARKDDPQARPLFWKRVDAPDELYLNGEAKRRAIVWEIFAPSRHRAAPAGGHHLGGRFGGPGAHAGSAAADPPGPDPPAARGLAESNPNTHPELPIEALSFMTLRWGWLARRAWSAA